MIRAQSRIYLILSQIYPALIFLQGSDAEVAVTMEKSG